MRRSIRRAAIVAGAGAVVLGSAVGVAVAAPAGAALAWAPASTDNFGTVTVGQTASQVFTLTDTSSNKATGLVTVSLTGSAAFTASSDGCNGATLSPGASCRVTVSYAPASGTASDSATLAAAGAGHAASVSVALNGSGAPASPGIATAPSAIGTGQAGGTAITDTVALAGGYQPTGKIEFQLYGPSTTASCSGTPVFDQTVTVNGDGGYTSPSFTPTSGGSYWWTAAYSGDGSNAKTASGCGAETVSITGSSSSFLYWADSGNGEIVRTPVNGGVGSLTVMSIGTNPKGVTQDGSHLYWTDYSDAAFDANTGAIWEMSLSGGSPAIIIPNVNDPTGIAVYNAHIYYAAGGSIIQANTDGSGVTTLITGANANGLAVDSSGIYYTQDCTNCPGDIMKANLDGSNPVEIVSGQANPEQVTLFGGHMYWATQGQNGVGQIQEANLDGTGVSTIFTDTGVGEVGVAVGSSGVFWSNAQNGTILEESGGPLVTISSGQPDPGFMTLGG